MNKTVTINLGGTVFHIDDNAYEALTKYLNSIKSRFSAEQGRDEIMQDIESRIGEMFRDRLKDSRQVITLADVEDITLTMGKPEEFASGEETATASQPEGQPLKRRVFRNPDDKIAAGVASGLAAYFNVDPLWIRLAFAAGMFLGGFTLWVYIVLWIILPVAKTSADKLMMKGEAVTVSNIEKNVREEMDAMKQHVKEGTKPGTVLGRFFEAVGEVIKFIFKVIGKIFAAFFVFIGLVIAVSIFASMFGLIGMPFFHYPEFFNHLFDNRAEFGWIFFAVALVIGIPFLMLAYAGTKMLFNIKKGSKVIGFSALALWLIGLFLLFIHGIHIGRAFAEKDSFRKEVNIQQPTHNLIVLKSDKGRNTEKDYSEYTSHDRWDMEVLNNKMIMRNVRFDIVKSPTDSFDLVEILYAHGQTRKAAIDNASMISYNFTQSDSVIKMDSYFTLGDGSKWRDQKVQVLVRMPVGSKIRLDESLRGLFTNLENVQNIWDDDMVNRTWEMTEKGLSCLDCDGTEDVVGGEHVYIHDHGNTTIIDKHGIYTESPDGDKVSINHGGMHIRSKGKDVVRIDRHGVIIDTDSSHGGK